MRLKRPSVLTLVLGILLIALMVPVKVQAASLPFSIRPVIPQAQRDTSESFFDVVVAPSESTELQAQLVNNTDQQIQIQVKVNTAQTSDNGIVVYGAKEQKDTAQYSLTDYLKGPDKITIPAKGTYLYTAQLTMPTNQLPGVMAGALTFSPSNQTDTTEDKSGLSVVNQYNYEIAVITRNVNQTWQPELKIGQAKIQQHEYQNTLAVPLQNISATFLNQLHVKTQAINLTTGKKYQRTADSIQMAPNSQFDYRLELPSATAGKYRVTTNAYYVKSSTGEYKDSAGETYKYKLSQESTLIVSPEKAKKLNKKSDQAKGGRPWMIYAIIAGFALLILIIILLLILLLRKNRKTKKL
ncbi:WxL protein peptidoglycan domain-containing protein [Enterococcus xiangfangensis]|uniref:DUF916 domain-containing protein n=1 Tax=Enterococcus xiangfangensis TaxID=1296537 RepID=UPI003D1855F1|nr:DUF916 domain-containing protein [Enterococcus asini]